MKTWFVTGASRGFGRELTEQLLARGDRVAATLRRPEQLDDLATTHGDRLWRAALDVTGTDRLHAVVDAAFTELGRIDVVVSNAGSGTFGAAEELTDAQVEDMLAVNLTASIHLARFAVPHLREQGGGLLMQVSSMGGQMSFPAFSLYHASKWGIEGFYEALAPEVAPFGIRTVLVEPGMIRTSFFDAAQHADELPAYEHLHGPRISVADMPGDQGRVVAAMIEAGERPDPPRRLVLGSDAHRLITEALRERSAEVAAQRDTAPRTDLVPGEVTGGPDGARATMCA
ncbi:SDR family oxidoreductase [Actinomycetospora endophytica]|uniref:SDR family oxidoreductase n=1 Tax=Actinomycetospora endophytica TaxID=2291215 RepID=A0ABS8PFW7_9PSEU|nr:SDR family oxidoreductase [Actinomycetospora endophytica]MCD2197177.1 SDR family oxidoreductase [Actinomycetospora endophytica]